MKKAHLLTLLALIITLGITSCSKPGCIDPAASNYDPDADESDGSCMYPCTMSCYNGGIVTSDCDCNCPAGFTGVHCETPVAPVIQDCEKYHTANVTFKNNSTQHYAYDIVLDGALLTTISYQTVSIIYTVAVGQHTISFKIHGTNNYACTTGTPVLIECSSHQFSCDY